MKKFLFQICAICILSLSFNSVQAQCDHCYEDAMDLFMTLEAPSGECGDLAWEQLNDAVDRFNSATTPGAIDHAGYALMHNLINYMSMLNSCYGECGSPGCEASVAASNSMVNCLKSCQSPYADALCNTGAYIECQCDCDCDNWWLAECDDFCCDEVRVDFALSTGEGEDCWVVTAIVVAPEGCDLITIQGHTTNDILTDHCTTMELPGTTPGQTMFSVCCPDGIPEGGGMLVTTDFPCNIRTDLFILN